jgi:CysZ protein
VGDKGALSKAPRSLARGAAWVPRGFWYLVRHPRLWPIAALPSVVVAVFLVGGLVFGLWLAREVAGETPLRDFTDLAPVILKGVVAVAVVASSAILAVALAFVVASPFLDLLSRRVEAQEGGITDYANGSLRWELVQSLWSDLYFLRAAPIVFVLSLIPFVGPVLGALWGAHALSLQETDVPLARRGLRFKERRVWHRARRAESLGFGLAGLLPMIAFPLNLVLAPLSTPALAIAATLFVIDEEKKAGLTAPPPTIPAPALS